MKTAQIHIARNNQRRKSEAFVECEHERKRG